MGSASLWCSEFADFGLARNSGCSSAALIANNCPCHPSHLSFYLLGFSWLPWETQSWILWQNHTSWGLHAWLSSVYKPFSLCSVYWAYFEVSWVDLVFLETLLDKCMGWMPHFNTMEDTLSSPSKERILVPGQYNHWFLPTLIPKKLAQVKKSNIDMFDCVRLGHVLPVV